MKKISITLLLCGLISFGYSQVQVQNRAKVESIKKLLDITGSGKMGVQVAGNMISNFKTTYKDIPEEFWDELQKGLNAEELVNMIIPIYEKYYTEEDIKQLIEFYQTPIGKKVLSNIPLIMQESMQAGQSWGQKLAEKVIERIKAKGYLES